MTYYKYLRKSWEIIGWTADADYWCLDCAAEEYGVDPTTHAEVLDHSKDVVHPVYVVEDVDGLCGACGERIE